MIQIIKQNYVNFRSKCFPSHWNFTLHEQIWLKLHFQLTLLIPSRKLCVILITDTNYIISSFHWSFNKKSSSEGRDYHNNLKNPPGLFYHIHTKLWIAMESCTWERTCQSFVHNTSVSETAGSISYTAFLVYCHGCFPLIKQLADRFL